MSSSRSVPRPRIADPRIVPVVGHDGHLAAVAIERLSPGWLRERLATPLDWTPEKLGDGGLFDGHQRTDAAVLVPLVERDDGLTVLLTQRTAHLTAHAGQISFPGGRIEAHDPDPESAALRETEEEVGLPRDRISVIGRLDTYLTGTGFEITPVVGIVRPPFPLAIDPFEVAEAFEVPLSYILDRRNHQRVERQSGAHRRVFYVLPYEGRNIWGATAGILVNLAEVLVE
jgi:8-oxo-dGTP pyrophosphatase MutT (NUDIX family)